MATSCGFAMDLKGPTFADTRNICTSLLAEVQVVTECASPHASARDGSIARQARREVAERPSMRSAARCRDAGRSGVRPAARVPERDPQSR